MQLPDDGTQGTPTGSTGGGSVSVDDYSTLIGLGQQVSDLRTFADTARGRLETATGAADAFGSYPAGQSFASHHDAVAQVMSSTMGGVSTDIDTFGTNIVTSAKNYRDTDDTAAGCMQALGSVLSGPSTAQDSYDDARTESGSNLSDVSVDPDVAAAAGTSEQTTEMLRGADGTETTTTSTSTPASSPEGPQVG